MDRNFRKESAAKASGSPPSEAWLYAQALLGNPIPTPASAQADAQHRRELLEWLEQIAPEKARELRRESTEAADAAHRRKLLEWVASFSPRHETELRRLRRAEADAREAQQRWEQFAESVDGPLAEWDEGKPRRGGYPQNTGMFS